jgi:hypothetical protein
MFGDLLESVGLSGFLSDGQWRTLHNGTRVKLDAAGRIVAGLPSRFHGIHVRDLSELTRRERAITSTDCDDTCASCPKTFADKAVAVAALLDANPELRHLLESDGGAGSKAFRAWVRGGRRGSKPAADLHDGRFDALNEAWELRGFRRVGSWLEAIYTTVPTSRKWAELSRRLPTLAEAAGFEIHAPSEALRLDISSLDAEQCREAVDRALDELFHEATAARLTKTEGAGDEVPF